VLIPASSWPPTSSLLLLLLLLLLLSLLLSLLLLLLLQMLVDFYGVESSFPLATHLITRSLEAAFPKRLYYVSKHSTQCSTL
jgi:hypothetical protein